MYREYPNKLFIPLHSVSDGRAKQSGCEIGWLGYNISSQARSRYSSLATVLGSKTPRSAALFRTRVHALHSLSAQGITGGSEVPAYDRCYILTTDIYVIVFRTVPIKIYYAVLIATPKPFFRWRK